MPIRKVSFENPHFTGTEAAKMPVGTTAERANAVSGDLRHNSTTGVLEQYTPDGWQSISPSPVITAISPTSISNSDSSVAITITGSAFSTASTVVAIGQDASQITPTTVSRTSSNELVATFDGTQFSDAQEDYSIKVTNNTGLAATLDSSLSVNAAPTWTTTSNSIIGTVVEDHGATLLIYGNSANSTYTTSASSEQGSSYVKNRFIGYEPGVSTGWGPALGTNHWWKIDLGAGTDYVLDEWSHYQGNGQGSLTRQAIEGSNDDSTWTEIVDHTAHGVSLGSTNGKFLNFTIPSSFNTVYRYLRYKIEYSSANWGYQNGLNIVVRKQTVGSVAATDPEGGSVTYSATSGLPAGMTLNSDGTLTGVPTGNTWSSGDTTHNVVIAASDGSNSTNRTFRIIRKEINEEENPVTTTNPLIDLKYNSGSYTNTGSASLTSYGTHTYTAGGPYDSNGFHETGISFQTDYYVAGIGTGGLIDGGAYTFMGWYKGTQTNVASGSWSVGNAIFGDPRGSVYLGCGVDDGKIAIGFNGITRGEACNDGNWHHLAFVHYSNNVMYAYLDGKYQFNVNTGGYSSSKRLDYILSGYAYSGCTAPTAVDGIKIYGDTLSGNQIRAMYYAGFPSTV